jgi:hypothetical protein
MQEDIYNTSLGMMPLLENHDHADPNCQSSIENTELVDNIANHDQNIIQEIEILKTSPSPLNLEYTVIIEKNILEKNYEPELKVKTQIVKSWTGYIKEGVSNIVSAVAVAVAGGGSSGGGDDGGDDDDISFGLANLLVKPHGVDQDSWSVTENLVKDLKNKHNWELSQEVINKIPSNLFGKAMLNTDNVGIKWIKDTKGQDVIRINKGDVGASFPSQRVDYVKIIHNGKVIGRDGNPIMGKENGLDPADNPRAHIPKDEWVKWNEWNEWNEL